MHSHIVFDEATLPPAAGLPAIIAAAPRHRRVPRGVHRWDYQNPPPRSAAGRLLEQVWRVVWPLMQPKLPSAVQRQSATLAIVDPGEPAQPFHCDADGDTAYFTILVPLTTEWEAGGTVFQDGVMYLAVRGLAYCFDGAVEHRGSAHRGQRRRVFAAFVVAPGVLKDPNVFA
jgi:hypothetical protein